MPDQKNNATDNKRLTEGVVKWALVTGSARRIGSEIARVLHANGFNIFVHHRRSKGDARKLQSELDERRPGSAELVGGDLLDTAGLPRIIQQCIDSSGRLDVLVNNASTFYPTPLGTITEAHWEELTGTNLKAPLFLSQAAAPLLRETEGCIVNIVDIHAHSPLPEHSVYCAAKAGLDMLTRSLARDLAPHVRVNGVAPGSILWPEPPPSENEKNAILEETPLARLGDPRDIAECVLYLIRSPYVTGQIIAVDGGRSLGSTR